MKILKRSVLLSAAAGIFLLTGCTQAQDSEISLIQPVQEAEGTEEKEAVLPEAEEGIYVHICGAVRTPGVYAMPEGSRFVDAVNAAGGLTEEADAGAVNLAEAAEDGVQIYIPSLRERQEAGMSGTGAQARRDGKVNLNQAGADELCTLPGIGESRADEIIRYREANGGFETIEEIMKVTGIKQGLFEKIKEKIYVK